MNISFECTCGTQIEESVDGSGTEADLNAECPECGQRHIVTITAL